VITGEWDVMVAWLLVVLARVFLQVEFVQVEMAVLQVVLQVVEVGAEVDVVVVVAVEANNNKVLIPILIVTVNKMFSSLLS
jgi:hypothetical protein